jgi:hypothetical protein
MSSSRHAKPEAREIGAVVRREETAVVERFGEAVFPGSQTGNAVAALQAEVAALKEEAVARRARDELLKEQRTEALQHRAIWVPAVLSVISIIVSIASLGVAIWAVLRTR